MPAHPHRSPFNKQWASVKVMVSSRIRLFYQVVADGLPLCEA
jgi:hypothetical protein